MKFFQAEGHQCDSADRDNIKKIITKIANIVEGSSPDLSDLKNALQEFGVLGVSFEGDKKQVGFFHRYDEGCSIKLTDLFQDIKPCLTSPSCGSPSDRHLTPAEAQRVEKILSGAAPDVRFTQGSVKIDWVRVSLLAAVIVLTLLLLFVSTRGMA